MMITKEPLKGAALLLAFFFAAGFVMHAGSSAADWLIPDPPRAPLKVKHEIKGVPEEPDEPDTTE